MTTATSSLQAHLLKNHVQEWVMECQRLNIDLRGKEGEEALAKFTGLPIQHQAEVCIPFSQGSFLDGLVQFIVGTNQVFFFFLSLIFSLIKSIFSGHKNCGERGIPTPLPFASP